MATPQATAETRTELRITRTLAVPREKVFRAWTDPEALKRWFFPKDGFETNVPSFDLAVGGRYRIEMKSPEGKVHIVTGAYREVRPPERLVFTWKWENAPEEGESLVTVELYDRGGRTDLVLRHDLLATAEAREEHSKGWAGCLDHLEKFVWEWRKAS